MKLNLQPYHLEEITNKGFNMNHICMLKFIYEGVDISSFVDEKEKLAVVIQEMIRKGILTEDKKITSLGTELLVFMDSKAKRRIVKPKTDDGEFDLWWEAYRKSDDIFLSDKTGNPLDTQILMSGSRGLRVRKEDCRIKFNAILLKGIYSSEDLIRALKYEINAKIKKSFETRQNKLSYMQNTLTYLNQESYIDFVSISKSTTNNTNISNNSNIYI